MIKYFVSYVCWDKNGNQGFGNAVFDSNGKLDNLEIIQHAEKRLTEKYVGKNIVKILIMNFQMI